MMKRNSLKVALVTDSLFKMAGSSKVLECFAEIYPEADIFTLFSLSGKRREKVLSKSIYDHKIINSSLNKIPFIEKFYRYTLPRWPFVIEKFDFSEYDLVISSSWAISHGIITPLNTKHISYIHTPMRYIWDMYYTYFGKKKFKWIYSLASHLLRIWDSSASSRADLMISNSNFVSERMHKYWRRKADYVLYPPISKYKGEIYEEREDYFVSGAPYESNKGGELLLESAKWLGFRLKILGDGAMRRSLERKYSDCKNIEFLGWVGEDDKFSIMSKASGYIITGIEDFGIFPVEAMSCGTPVLGYRSGGVVESIQENVNGMFFNEQSIEDFKRVFDKFSKKIWDHKKVSESVVRFNDKEGFKKDFEGIVNSFYEEKG